MNAFPFLEDKTVENLLIHEYLLLNQMSRNQTGLSIVTFTTKGYVCRNCHDVDGFEGDMTVGGFKFVYDYIIPSSHSLSYIITAIITGG